jgi:hypothetical protein
VEEISNRYRGSLLVVRVGSRQLALIDRLWRAWSPSFTLDA